LPADQHPAITAHVKRGGLEFAVLE